MKNEQVIIDLKEYERLKKVDLEKQDVNVNIMFEFKSLDGFPNFMYDYQYDSWSYLTKLQIGDKLNYQEIVDAKTIIDKAVKIATDLQKVHYEGQLNEIKSKWWYKLFS